MCLFLELSHQFLRFSVSFVHESYFLITKISSFFSCLFFRGSSRGKGPFLKLMLESCPSVIYAVPFPRGGALWRFLLPLSLGLGLGSETRQPGPSRGCLCSSEQSLPLFCFLLCYPSPNKSLPVGASTSIVLPPTPNCRV